MQHQQWSTVWLQWDGLGDTGGRERYSNQGDYDYGGGGGGGDRRPRDDYVYACYQGNHSTII